MVKLNKKDNWFFASLWNYKPSWLVSDAIAALTLAAIAIPEQLATARLVGMPPMAGLLAFAAGTFAFAAFGQTASCQWAPTPRSRQSWQARWPR